MPLLSSSQWDCASALHFMLMGLPFSHTGHPVLMVAEGRTCLLCLTFAGGPAPRI